MSDIEGDDFINDLDDDFGSESESEENIIEIEQDEIILQPSKEKKTTETPICNDDIITRVRYIIKDFVPYDLSKSLIHDIDPEVISKVKPVGKQIQTIMHSKDVKLDDVLSELNELSPLIQAEIAILKIYMVQIYSSKFKELEDLIPSAMEYANVIYILETSGDCSNEELSDKLEHEVKLKKEQILVLIMSMKTSFQRNIELEDISKTRLYKAREHIDFLNNLRNDISAYISSKIHLIAPNVCALLGPEITSFLISHAGGILGLSRIPNCNLASIGKNKHLSHEQHTISSGVRQEGYINRAEIIQNQPVSVHKQMQRMVCAKVSLASRIDAGQKGTEKDNSHGIKWREELDAKIKKLLSAPGVATSKALPVPEDKTKKKRAGRKFRKYKEQFQLSHVRQLQNRMEFGKQESSVMDSYGEEIGLGMSNTPMQQASGITNSIDRNVNNSSKLTKRMKHRLKEADDLTQDYMLSLGGDSGKNTDNSNKKQKTQENEESWFSHHLK